MENSAQDSTSSCSFPSLGSREKSDVPAELRMGKDVWSVFICLENVPNLCDQGSEQAGPTLM